MYSCSEVQTVMFPLLYDVSTDYLADMVLNIHP